MEKQKSNIYPQIPSMDYDELESSPEEVCHEHELCNRIPEKNLVRNPYQKKLDQNFQKLPVKNNSPDAKSYPEGAFHNSQTNRNDSQLRRNRRRKALPQQSSSSDYMDEEESPMHYVKTKDIRHLQNTSKRARQDKVLSPTSQVYQDLHNKDNLNCNISAKPRHGKNKSQNSAKSSLSETIQSGMFCMKTLKTFFGECFALRYFLFFPLPIVLLIFYNFSGTFFPTNVNPKKNQFNATDVVLNLKSEFPEQPSVSFRIIYSALNRVSQSKPDAPAIIVLLAANGSETECNKFAHRLVTLLYSLDTVQISGEDYRQQNVNAAKKEIDDSLQVLKKDRLGAVLVEDLDRIPGEAALIFHTYWDHENAPYKRAVFVMTVAHGKAIDENAEPKVWDKAVQDHLYSAWGDIGIDQISPLLSRLTVSVVAIIGKSA
ncbi:hypothetical protein NPIL_702251 [Nephila pilipes]|uniref:Torsin-1A-interacting protein 1/2 AAA+ activator domain-containing protein n=1 Tax=Nephila pilipes TaxID=299642 RepID=A0A8X6N423_NEPPI|nr:hypothetical protein NPIL_702251 [Nephila pilipes]